MSDNPYFIHGPALISFSGGRTSAYMLKRIIDTHGGTLPEDVHVCFANTGKEREETLRFVHECSTRWGIRVRWLEWRDRPHGKEGRATAHADRFDEVGYNSAARNGEPFKALIQRKRFLPNAATRFCTSHLKVETMKSFMRAQGHDRWLNIIGLRRDEMHRVFKQISRNEKGLERFRTEMPMATAVGAATKRDVMNFWLGENTDPKLLTSPLPQGFDLGLRDYEGNCDGCFLKGYQVLAFQEREQPGSMDWWSAMEGMASRLADKPSGARFTIEYSYADIKRTAETEAMLPGIFGDEFDAECGLWCSGEAA